MPTLALADYALTEVDPSVRKRRGVAVPVSVGLHAVAAAALAIVPLLMSDALPKRVGTSGPSSSSRSPRPRRLLPRRPRPRGRPSPRASHRRRRPCR